MARQYHTAPMSKQTLTKHFEPYRMADQGAVFEGTLPVSSFTRLCEGLVDDMGDLHIAVEFAVGEDGYREMTGRASGLVHVQCQRCMDVMQFDLESDIHLGFAFHDEMAKSIPKHLDAMVVLPDGQVSIIDLVEDELILSLPQFAMHAVGQCEIKTEFGDPVDPLVVQDQEKINPFSILAQIKSSGNEN